jgi:ribosomal protein S18
MRPVVAQINESENKVSRISWPAVFAGALTALAIAFLLNILGLGIGLSTVDPLTDADPLAGLGTGTIVWWTISNLAALFIGGMVAARMSGLPSNVDGALHGFLSWALYAIVSIYFVTSTIGSVMNGMASAASGLFGSDNSKNVVVQLEEATKQGQEQTATSYKSIKQQAFKLINAGERFNVLPDDTSEEARDLLQDSRKEFKNLNLEEDIETFFNDLSFDLDEKGNLDISVDGNKDFFDKATLKDYLTDNTELDDAEINGLINKWEKNIDKAVTKAENLYAKAKQKALVYSDKAAEAVSKYSIIAFFVFLLGAMAAVVGGATGSPEYTLERENRIKKNKE